MVRLSDPFETLRIRPGEPGDHARVRKDWRLSYVTSDFAHFCSLNEDWWKRAAQLYWDWQNEIVDRLLATAELWIACWEEDPNSIVGWAVMEPARGELSPVVHYVNVKPEFRAHHVAKRLLAPALEHRAVIYTHRTRVCRHLPIPPAWTYDPRLAVVPRAKEK